MRIVVGAVLLIVLVGFIALASYIVYLDREITTRFQGRRWDLPAQVYARPLELYAGRTLAPDALDQELHRLGYLATPNVNHPGAYRRVGNHFELQSRSFRFWDGAQPTQHVIVDFEAGQIVKLSIERQTAALARLDPVLIGSVFTAHGEDRIIVRPDEVPPLLPAALKAVEDQRFDEHHGIDPLGIVRALLRDVRSASLAQGGSTLTQQLVRSYWLSNERTVSRKVIEALMALILEYRYSKEDLMNAYINEIFLAQEGDRAIHGFGLASQYYFGKPLAELDVHEVALLVTVVRGPSWYNPRTHEARTRARRDLVLKLLAERGVINEAARAHAASLPLDVRQRPTRSSAYYPAFMDLVRRQLHKEYKDEDLTNAGLKVFTTLDPLIQADLEQELSSGIDRLQKHLRNRALQLEGAGVVTSVQSAEVLAIVGGRRAGFEGYNRALDAKRQIGSLIKPVLYSVAFSSGDYNLASVVDASNLDVALDSGRVWRPSNFEKEPLGPMTIVHALANSVNTVAVRVGMDIGVEDVAILLKKMSGAADVGANPSLLLGAVELTPFQVAQMYNTFANLGFRSPLRGLRSVIDGQGQALQRYPLELEQVVEPEAVYQVNEALVQVLKRGTGATAGAQLPVGRVFAGKTGTTNDFRDSWFAGFSGDHVAVIWVGEDGNAVTGLTGGRGALTIWAPLMAHFAAQSYDPPLPSGLEQQWIDYTTGEGVLETCGDAVLLPMPQGARVAMKPGCGGTAASVTAEAPTVETPVSKPIEIPRPSPVESAPKPSTGERLTHWFKGLFN